MREEVIGGVLALELAPLASAVSVTVTVTVSAVVVLVVMTLALTLVLLRLRLLKGSLSFEILKFSELELLQLLLDLALLDLEL